MARLIDADALMKNWERDKGRMFDADYFIFTIEDAPTIDAVQVVRCRDCKFAHMTYGGECKYCDVWESEESLYLDGDFFCAFGERKDDE